MKNYVLKADGLFLMIMGTAAACSEIAGYFFAKGPLGKFYYGNNMTIGGFEAHCLAIIMGFILLSGSKSVSGPKWTRIAIIVHFVLGTSNLIWFQSFIDFNMLAMGYITTIFHYLFVVLNGIALYYQPKLKVAQK